MRMIVFFDLPTETAAQRRAYRQFRKGLMKNGFMMLQESVYCRLVITPTVGDAVLAAIRKLRPEEGQVAVLSVTERQFSGMVFITGEKHGDVIDSQDGVVIL